MTHQRRRRGRSLQLRIVAIAVVGLAVITASAVQGNRWVVSQLLDDHATAELSALARTFDQVVPRDVIEDPVRLGAALRSMKSNDEQLLDVLVVRRGANGRLHARDGAGRFVPGPFEPYDVEPLWSGRPTWERDEHGAQTYELNFPLSNAGDRPYAMLSLVYDVAPAYMHATQLHRRLVVGSLAVAAVVLALLFVLLRRSLLRPLASLARTVSEIRLGNRSSRTQAVPTRELRDLADGVDSMADAIEHQQASMEMRARTDDLTGLATRSELLRGLERELAVASDECVAVAMVDIAGVALFNVRWGQAAGDQALVSAARALEEHGRGVVTGRLSGATLGLVMRGEEAEILRRLHAVRHAVAEVQFAGELLSCAIGYAIVTDGDTGPATLVERAAAALTWARSDDAAAIRKYDPTQPRSLAPHDRRAEIEATLAEPDSMRIVLQPIVSLSTGSIVGFEALARFANGRPPDVMFEQAHLCGLGPRLEGEAVRRALALGGRPAGTYLSLNASPSAIRSPEFVCRLPEDLSEVVIEITEHEDVVADATTLEHLAELRSRGARLAIDDVGAGYAGLTQVMALRPEIVKLDRALIRGLHESADQRALVEAMVRFTVRAGAQLCAEGIETVDELRAATDLDVELGQGYLLARPGPAWPDLDPVVGIACRTALDDALAGHAAACEPMDALECAEQFAEALAEARDLDDVARTIGVLERATGGVRVVLSRREPGGDSLLALGHDGWWPSSDPRGLEVLPAAHRVLEQRLPLQVRVGDEAADAPDRAFLAGRGLGSALLMPVLLGETAVAVLTVYTFADRPLRRSAVRQMRLAARQLGATLAALSPDRDLRPLRHRLAA